MKLKANARRLLACSVVAAMAMTPAFVLAQDQSEPPRERARQEAEERARAEDRAARAEERAARRAAERAAREGAQAAQEAERAARAQMERAAQLAPAQPPQPGQPAQPQIFRQEGDGIFRIRPAEVEMKPQTYLGVSTHQATPEVLGKDADVPAGVGLVVSYVDEEGPAGEAGLKPNDVLIKMDDQWLVNPAQLTVLIRMHKKGDEATFTVLRDGEEEELEVSLGEKELPVAQPGGMFQMAPLAVPPAPMVPAIRGLPEGQGPWMHGPEGFQPIPPERMEEINKQIEKAMAELEKHMQGQDMGDLEERMQELREQLQERQLQLERLPLDANRRVQRGLLSGGRLFMNNEDVTLRMVNEDGEVTIVVEDADGETLYEGPYPEEEEIEELPEEAQDIIRQAEKYLPRHENKLKIERESRGRREQAPAPGRRRPAAEEDEQDAPTPPARRRESIPV